MVLNSASKLLPEISSLNAFCDGVAAAAAGAGIGDSRSWDHLGPSWTILDHFDHFDQF